MDKMFIRKDVYEDLIEKGYGKRDLSKLTKKQITDKNGHKRTVYVKNGEQPAAQKQPTAQKELSPEKRAKYEEMLEKVKNGPDEYALFVSTKGMLNKKDAIAHLEAKLGKKTVNSAAEGHLESDTPQNTDITKEDEERFGKQALSGLSGKRTSSEETKKTESENITYEQAAKAVKEGKTVQWKDRNGEWNDVDPRTSELVMARDMGSKLRVKPDGNKKPTKDDMKENYLDAKNEAGKDIAENNKIQKLSDKIKFSPEEMKMIRETAAEIGYRVGRDEGKLLNAIYSKDKAMYSALTNKNQKVWDESGKTQKTFSTTDLLKEKIQSMKGDFGADTEKTSLKDKVKEWEDKGLPKDAAYTKVAFDDLYDGYENKFDEEKEEINEAFRDIQKNGLKAKYFKDHAKEYGLSSDENKTENSDKIKAKEEYMNEVSDWQKKGLPRDAAFAKVALDRIVKEIKKTPKDDVQKLDELDDMFRDVQLNNTRSKYIKNILDIE